MLCKKSWCPATSIFIAVSSRAQCARVASRQNKATHNNTEEPVHFLMLVKKCIHFLWVFVCCVSVSTVHWHYIIKPGLYALPCTLTMLFNVTWSTAVIAEHMKRCPWSECCSSLLEILYRAMRQFMKVRLYQHLAQSNTQPGWNWYSSKSLANYWSGALVVTAENVRGTAQEDDKYFSPAV